MKIAGFMSKSLEHWDDLETAVIFLQGCNFSCPFCTKASLIPKNTPFKGLSLSEVFHYLVEDSPQNNRVVITGGEPLIHGVELLDFLEELKNAGFKIKLETNASNADLLRTIVQDELVDLVQINLKSSLVDDRHDEATGTVGLALEVQKSALVLRENRFPFEWLMVYVPSFHSRDEVVEIAQFCHGKERFTIQLFESSDDMMDSWVRSMSEGQMVDLQDLGQQVSGYFKKVQIRSKLSVVPIEKKKLPA